MLAFESFCLHFGREITYKEGYPLKFVFCSERSVCQCRRITAEMLRVDEFSLVILFGRM